MPSNVNLGAVFRVLKFLSDKIDDYSSDDEPNDVDEGGNSGDKDFEKVVDDDDIDRVSESSCMCGDDFVLKKVTSIHSKETPHSNDPFNIYELLNKKTHNVSHSKAASKPIYPPGFSAEFGKKTTLMTALFLLLVRHLSDHRSVIMRESSLDYSPTPFCIFHFWFKMDGFDKLVEETWHSIDITKQNGLICMKKKLQLVENSTKFWSKYNKRKLNEAKFIAHNKLIELDKAIDQGCGNDDILNQRTTLMKELNDINSIDVLELTQKSKMDYLDDVLKSFGFGDKQLSWIIGCLNSAKGSVLIDVSPTSESKFYKGLKQGDSLSLFLFILAMKSLHLSFKRVLESRLFKGVKVGAAMSRLNSWNEVIDKISSILSKWNLKPFYRGRLTLLKSVLTAIPIYHMSLFKAYVTVIKYIHGVRGAIATQTPSNRSSMWIDLVRGCNSINKKTLGALGDLSIKSVRRLIDMTLLPKSDNLTRWVNLIPTKVMVLVCRWWDLEFSSFNTYDVTPQKWLAPEYESGGVLL
uniref:RNA-directed DNA polymerase, eukaryota n=1 Tax=Tanacetum cinerariifolium TaxID=118510 RepID=A0A6L2NR23_TANCI|nr:RNA-directed DNA polymerase, eukaryota [Tanacetum cinerariifolium]